MQAAPGRITGEPAFVLHARRWRETSLLVEVLSANHGRLGLLARGTNGPRQQPLRAALQPMQLVRLDAVQRSCASSPRLAGEAMLAGFYVNELVLRLAPRQDPQPDLFAAYGRMRARLSHDAPLAWTLRRFERDLLESLGVGFDLAHDAEGMPVDPAARYRLDPEQGPRRLHSDRGHGDRSDAATGRALLALADDAEPEPDDLAGLRRALRQVLAHHLGGRGLKSWELLGGGREPAPGPL